MSLRLAIGVVPAMLATAARDGVTRRAVSALGFDPGTIAVWSIKASPT